ncbi:hypothetical protein MAQ5080_00880 [Marinomonas aquimarina]|uniref:DUF6933 domain-containing protein n=1 Tax=Marinomonas aquimarina TaxID=295068 RepID=A0A1A8T687_9GAMM|nr:hypothetical protein [Marinomonas aquimarina]SBS27650.1 hypothetical protein MAQ5080_00880 [Marinomonas aquimarina]
MIRLHCTNKLLPKLPTNANGRLPSSASQVIPGLEALNPLSGWHGSLFLVKGRNCVICVHEATRLAIYIPCLNKADFADLDRLFAQALLQSLEAIQATEEQINTAKQLLQPLVIDDECKDAMHMCLNQAKACIEQMLWDDNTPFEKLPFAKASFLLAEMPFNLQAQKEVVWPKKLMLRLLDDAAASYQRATSRHTSTDGHASPDGKVVSMVDFKKPRKS